MKIENFKVGKADASVRCYLHDSFVGICDTHERRPAILLIPGGGYQHVSPREADPVAFKFFSHGINVFILTYSTGSAIKVSKPIFEAAEAMCRIRERAEEFSVDAAKVCIMGFSAGAHLALSVAALHSNSILSDYPHCRPDCAVLIYPVVSSGIFSHARSFDNLCENEEEREFYSLEKRINETMVPAFIVHAANAPSVPVENSLALSLALSANRIPFELHILPEGGHGFSTATEEVGRSFPHDTLWPELCYSWLSMVLKYTE